MPNQHVIWGTIDSDITVRNVGQDNKKVAEFRINDGKTWITVVAWEGLAAKVEALAKGTYLIVGGRQQTRSYEKDGQKRYATETVASTIDVIGAQAPAEDDLGIPD